MMVQVSELTTPRSESQTTRPLHFYIQIFSSVLDLEQLFSENLDNRYKVI